MTTARESRGTRCLNAAKVLTGTGNVVFLFQLVIVMSNKYN